MMGLCLDDLVLELKDRISDFDPIASILQNLERVTKRLWASALFLCNIGTKVPHLHAF